MFGIWKQFNKIDVASYHTNKGGQLIGYTTPTKVAISRIEEIAYL